MSNTIIVKHRTGSSGEPTLTTGEIAANILDKQIYIGTGAGNVVFSDKTYVDTQISNLVDSAPGTLDTLNELAAALGDDANFATTMTSSLANKADIASPNLTGTPTAPTATSGTNTTQIATTAYVQDAVTGAGGYNSWTVSDGSNSEAINNADSVIITGSGAASTSYDTGTNTLTITSTDTTYSNVSEFSNDSGYITTTGVTYTALNANADVGTGATQVARGDHNHAGTYEPVDANIARYNDVTANFTGTLQEGGVNVLTVNDTIDGGTY